MAEYYPNRPYVGPNPNPKRPRMGPRMQHFVNPNDKRMPSYKDFVLSLPNDITEHEAQAKWKEFQTLFYREHTKKFFDAHKEEEWFRNKYRPIEMKRLKEAINESKSKRKAAYEQLIQKYNPDDLSLNNGNSKKVLKFLDNYTFLLDGATMEEIENDEAADKYSVSSIYIPFVHPSVDKAELEEFAASQSDYLRLAMSDAQPESNWTRKAWVTYKRTEQETLKKLCWDFNAHKFNQHEIKAVVNRELERTMIAHPMFNDISVVKADFKNLARILTYYEGEDCPLLESIKDYLIDETDEEAKLSGLDAPTTEDTQPNDNQKIFQTLDKILLYLRVVHSFDYYGSTEFTDEHDMPRRVGIIFLRSTSSPTFANDDSKKRDLDDFIKQHTLRTNSIIEKPLLSEAEQKQLDKKNIDEEVESFIMSQTLEKEPNKKYMCKLTKKKFIAPKFVRAHILNRCTTQLNEVRAHAEFFNNYIADPRRPM